MKMFMATLVLGLLLVGSVSAMTVNYYYHPQCGHCKNIAPFIQKTLTQYNFLDWNIVDTSVTPFDGGTPTLIINTDDGRNIKMVGSSDIPKYLECELIEQSNLNCQTYPASSSNAVSWFIKE